MLSGKDVEIELRQEKTAQSGEAGETEDRKTGTEQRKGKI